MDKIATALALLLTLSFALAPAASAEETGAGTNLALPTENTALFDGAGADFYQYITRNFQGQESKPWEGGQYGFVRDPIATAEGLVYSRFHEGIDIRPLRRDARGEPLDEVRAIAAGEVVHANAAAGYSNYGRYVVIEHRWDGASYYSLYGHLASINVAVGQKVPRGEVLGIMGHTGVGLDRERSHLHLELNLLLSRRFEAWYGNFVKNDPNRHGLYSGLNLTGIDIAKYYLAQRQQPGLSVPRFLDGERTFYKVALPATAGFDLHPRYPWMLAKKPDATPPSWIVSFSAAGIPLKVEAGENTVTTPTLVFTDKRSGSYSRLTRGVLTGSGATARLSESGLRQMQLLCWAE